VRLEGAKIAYADGKASLAASIEGGTAPAGTRIVLAVTFFGVNGPLGTQEVTVAAPKKGTRVPLEASIPAASAPIGITYQRR
jgi:hypothetical protein